ncbi:Eco57I restriction-modification methylase domain-containing protein [Pseudomonas aeruginosa]|uniref:Eco57I restriction-modification methylase domain-containing protein n=1 Tax=Pseudomonas aeruginosa TaxID=287 RepID=UPI001CF0B54B|nr:N-6 DNA methylase [Pseudomonas aeruginosa]MDQ4166058.1 N-6 DNA methylase [Pseudomonas aeruginosa]MDQ4175067.1 N-6 DNA methylase [Pseudomonas aeruginosa]MDQ4181827.1 N-6 DNA methylase [Pseudomonas aeruginosa]MDQ4185734.1 N-6 DNA methylase [Pseudomonas aeruginosa]MDQ4196635.1 N-6 DNA methylase [Pseudomonas aeruginosa]
MKRIRKTQTTLDLPTLKLEGGLFLPDQLEKAAQGRASAQSEADYGTPKGVKLKDEYSRAFQIACAQWQHFAAQMERADVDAAQLTTAFVHELLRDAFGYATLQATSAQSVGELRYPVSLTNGSLPVLVAPYSLGLDEADAHFAVQGGGSRRKAPFQAMQELLNASTDHLWGIVSNGRQLRLLRDAASLTRPSFLEVDLADLLGGQRYAEFANVWRLLHASRAPGHRVQGAETCIWEQWRTEGQQEGTRVRDGLRDGVEQALLTFGQGFLQHPDNHALRTALHDGTLSKDAFFQQLLRLVYRLIFVFTVEERGVLHPRSDSADAQAARRAYAEGYALIRLRELCLKRRARTRHDDQWQAIRIVFRGLAQGEPRLALPALGGLFAPAQCPDLDAASLDNAHLLAALQHLRWAKPTGAQSLVPVDYRNMGPEELGSVYESLLELVPAIDLPARTFGFVGRTEEGSTAGNARKLTGSYYTPDSLVQELIRSALDPVIEQRLAANPTNPTEALLAIRVIDPACGSGHFLLAAARRLAEKLAQLRSLEGGQEGAIQPQDYRHALREVVARCIFGVDRNPMAIELARMALWLEGYEEGRPLGFLDHHLQVGDALLGLTDLNVLKQGIAKDAYKTLSGDDKDVCKVLTKANAAGLKQIDKDLHRKQMLLGVDNRSGLDTLRAIETLPADTPEQVAAKEQAWRHFLEESAHSPLAHAADALVGAYLLPKTEDTAETVPTSITLHALLTDPQRAQTEHAAPIAAARAACEQARVFHWPLAFPQVFAQGGFDCVLGNPPWERIKLQEEEFFATRHRDVAEARNKAERAQRIQWLSEGMLARHLYPDLAHEVHEDEAEKRLYREFVTARRTAEAASVFAHVKGADGGRYPLTGVGDVNTYALFAETILQIHADSGRAGFIVPTGIATDDSTKAYFSYLTQNSKLVNLLAFENEEFIFTSVHHSFRFCLITLGRAAQAEFVFFARQPSQIHDPRRRFTLTPEEFRLINPNTLTCPVFRSERDAELTKRLYRAAPVLMRDAVIAGEGKQAKVLEPAQNPWGISFMTMFHMSNDSHLFKDDASTDRLPLYEAKLIHQFDHRWATYTPDGNSRDVTPAEKADPAFSVTPRYWVQAREVWLRLARLPEGLMKALKDGDTQAAVLCVTQLLFGRYLAEQRHTHPGMGIYPAWKAFVTQHPYARTIAPTSLGFVGDNPPCLQPLNEDYLPAESEATVQSYTPGARNATTWYATDPDAERAVLALAADYGHLPASEAALADEPAVLTLAERWLQAACPQWLMGWRDITSAHVYRTVIASVVPLVAVNHKTPLWFAKAAPSIRHAAALLGNFDALVLDYVARQKVGGTSLTYFYLKQFPFLPPSRYTEADLAFIVPRVLELTYTARDLQLWAEELVSAWKTESGDWKPGTPEAIRRSPLTPFPYDPDRRATLRAELDAYYAKLYGLTEEELRYILDPADVMGDDYPSETFRVLKNKELKEFGEYRTQRLVLEAWGRLEQASSAIIPQAQPARPSTPFRTYAVGYTPATEAEDWLAGLVCDILLQAGTCDDVRLRQILLTDLPEHIPHRDLVSKWLQPVKNERWSHICAWLRSLLGVPTTEPLSIRDAKGLAQVLGDSRTASLASALIEARKQQELALEQALAAPETPMQTEGLQKRG